MAAQKTDTKPQLSTILLLMAIISALFAIFAYMLSQRPAYDLTPATSATPTVKPITTVKELDTVLEDLNKSDTTSLINSELNKLSTDASGI